MEAHGDNHLALGSWEFAKLGLSFKSLNSKFPPKLYLYQCHTIFKSPLDLTTHTLPQEVLALRPGLKGRGNGLHQQSSNIVVAMGKLD